MKYNPRAMVRGFFCWDGEEKRVFLFLNNKSAVGTQRTRRFHRGHKELFFYRGKVSIRFGLVGDGILRVCLMELLDDKWQSKDD
jgi:hypothetical protein